MGRVSSIVVHLSPPLRARVTAMAADASISTSAMIVELVEKALASAPAGSDAVGVEAEIDELRTEYDRINAALPDLQRQLSLLVIRSRAFSADPEPPAPSPASPPPAATATIWRPPSGPPRRLGTEIEPSRDTTGERQAPERTLDEALRDFVD